MMVPRKTTMKEIWPTSLSKKLFSLVGQDRREEVAKPLFSVERWEALSRYDDAISAAVEQLRPFGKVWIDKLAVAYFSLNEDRNYLPNILRKLLEEAKQEELERTAEARKVDEQRWKRTQNGEISTDESLAILRRASAAGYTLSIERDGTFAVTKGSTVYLRSNADIIRFGRYI